MCRVGVWVRNRERERKKKKCPSWLTASCITIRDEVGGSLALVLGSENGQKWNRGEVTSGIGVGSGPTSKLYMITQSLSLPPFPVESSPSGFLRNTDPGPPG